MISSQSDRQESYFDKLPEANPLREKSMKQDVNLFTSIQTIFELKTLLDIQKGILPENEPLYTVPEKMILQQGLNQQMNSQSQGIEQMPFASYNQMNFRNSLKHIQKEEDRNVLKMMSQTQKDVKCNIKEYRSDRRIHFLNVPDSVNNIPLSKLTRENLSMFAQDNSDCEQTRDKRIEKLIYKKQNQHVLFNLNSGSLVVKDKTRFNNIEENGVRDNLCFESRFESGNLASAWKMGPSKYNLLVQQDINTNGYTQWFYFRVSNTRKQSNVLFRIGNFYKSDSLFNKGMKISILSEKINLEDNLNWFKGGENIKYSCQKNLRFCNISEKQPYVLEFNYSFNNENDVTYFAYSVPYTYSKLQKYIQEILLKGYKYLNIRPLCKSLLQNQLLLITITNPLTPLNEGIQKKAIFITARVHPGETISNFILEGLINFLVQDNPEANALREQFVFKIVPMLNPDGVIHGNYRSSIAGCDLNRRWMNPNKIIHPEVYYTKRAIHEVNEQYPVAFYCDVHGHSRKKDFFLYGCEKTNNFHKVRELPFILSKMSSFFQFGSCEYRMAKNKEATARQTLFRELGVDNIYTLEASFCGPSLEDVHFSINDYKLIGCSLAKAILLTFSDKKKILQNQNKVFMEDLYNVDPPAFSNGDQMDENIGSDSDPSGDNLDEKEILTLFSAQKEDKKKRRRVSEQQRMVLTSYFSKMPEKQAKKIEKPVVVDRQKEKMNFQSIVQSEKSASPLPTDEQQIKVYNFIQNQKKVISPHFNQVKTIFQQTNENSQNSLNPSRNAIWVQPKSIQFPLKKKKSVITQQIFQSERAKTEPKHDSFEINKNHIDASPQQVGQKRHSIRQAKTAHSNKPIFVSKCENDSGKTQIKTQILEFISLDMIYKLEDPQRKTNYFNFNSKQSELIVNQHPNISNKRDEKYQTPSGDIQILNTGKELIPRDDIAEIKYGMQNMNETYSASQKRQQLNVNRIFYSRKNGKSYLQQLDGEEDINQSTLTPNETKRLDRFRSNTKEQSNKKAFRQSELPSSVSKKSRPQERVVLNTSLLKDRKFKTEESEIFKKKNLFQINEGRIQTQNFNFTADDIQVCPSKYNQRAQRTPFFMNNNMKNQYSISNYDLLMNNQLREDSQFLHFDGSEKSLISRFKMKETTQKDFIDQKNITSYKNHIELTPNQQKNSRKSSQYKQKYEKINPFQCTVENTRLYQIPMKNTQTPDSQLYKQRTISTYI